MVFVIREIKIIYKYSYFKICVYIYVAYAGLRMSAHRDSPDDIHSAVENEKNTVTLSANSFTAYFTSMQIIPFGFAELYCCRCSRH